MIIAITPDLTDGKQYLKEQYARAIEAIGGTVRVIPHEADAETALDGAAGLILSGGSDVEPALYGCAREEACGEACAMRDALELKLLRVCRERQLPVLGICRGCQVINVFFSGTLTQDIPTKYGSCHRHAKDNPAPFDHEVRAVPGTRLFRALGERAQVNSYHHQAVDRLGDGLIASAFAPEGFPEAVETRDPDWFVLGVQWHPENTFAIDEASKNVFELFREAVRAREKR